jgi:predicted esterase
MKQDSNGLLRGERKANNGDDWWSRRFADEIARGYDLFWQQNKVSHFVDGVAIRTNIPRKRPNAGLIFGGGNNKGAV